MPRGEIDRAAYLRLTPSEYLKQGYCDPSGRPNRELFSTYATAACVQLEAAETSPQELSGTFEAIRQVLPWHNNPDPRQRLRDAVDEALQVASAMYNQPNNPGIVSWLENCADFVRTDRDIDAFLAHFNAVLRQYTVIIGVRTA